MNRSPSKFGNSSRKFWDRTGGRHSAGQAGKELFDGLLVKLVAGREAFTVTMPGDNEDGALFAV